MNSAPFPRALTYDSRVTSTREIRELSAGDVDEVVAAFRAIGWNKPAALYERGNVPDGRGVTYRYRTLQEGEHTRIDDDITLWFTRELRDLAP